MATKGICSLPYKTLWYTNSLQESLKRTGDFLVDNNKLHLQVNNEIIHCVNNQDNNKLHDNNGYE